MDREIGIYVDRVVGSDIDHSVVVEYIDAGTFKG